MYAICIHNVFIMYTYIHTYIYTYIHTYIQTDRHTYIHTCMLTRIHPYIHTTIHPCIHASMHAHTHAYIHSSIQPYIHTFMHPCIHIHTYTHTHIHTYIYIDIYMYMYIDIYMYIYIWGCIKTRYLFKWPKITLSFLFTHRFLSLWTPCRQLVWVFQLLWVRASLVESQQMSSFVFISFLRLSCCIHFLSRAFHFAFMSHSFPFILLSCPFMFRRYVSKIQVFENWYVQTCEVGIRPNARVVIILLSFLLSFSYRFEGLCRLPSSGFMNMYMHKRVIVFFHSYRCLGRQCIGSVKVQTKLKLNARGYYTIPCRPGIMISLYFIDASFDPGRIWTKWIVSIPSRNHKII